MLKGQKECTTLCYIEKDGKYLLMHRHGRDDDENSGKYIGVGGHLEKDETPEECLLREVKEETGLTLKSFKLRGLLTFAFENKDELAFLYTSDDFEGTVSNECEEGTLKWIDKDKVLDLPLWDGDSVFLSLLNEREDYFSLKLKYIKEELIEVVLDGVKVVG